MLVHEVMSSPAITVTANTPVQQALRMLDVYGITAMPVVGAHREVIGVVSEADLVREAVLPDGRAHMMPEEVARTAPARQVGDVMTTGAVTVSSRADLADAVELMTSTMVKSLPVVDAGRVVGVVSRKDVVHMLARRDEMIAQEAGDLLRTQSPDWSVEVTDGVALVTGPADEHERRIAEVLAATVPGIVAVEVDDD